VQQKQSQSLGALAGRHNFGSLSKYLLGNLPYPLPCLPDCPQNCRASSTIDIYPVLQRKSAGGFFHPSNIPNPGMVLPKLSAKEAIQLVATTSVHSGRDDVAPQLHTKGVLQWP